MFKKVKIKHTRGVVDLRVRSGESGDRVSYENVIDFRELDKMVEERKRELKEQHQSKEINKPEHISITVDNKLIKFKIPIKIDFRREKNFTVDGLNGSYILSNEELKLRVVSSNIKKGMKGIQEELKRLYYDYILAEDKEFNEDEIIFKGYLQSLVSVEEEVPSKKAMLNFENHVLRPLQEEAEREKYPLMPEKRLFSEPNTEVVIANARKVTEDLDWLRRESMKESLDRKLEGTYDPYQEKDRRILGRKRKETISKISKVRKFLCKIGIHKWSRKTYIDYGPTSNVKNWKRYCKICGKRQSWVQAKGDKKWFRGK